MAAFVDNSIDTVDAGAERLSPAHSQCDLAGAQGFMGVNDCESYYAGAVASRGRLPLSECRGAYALADAARLHPAHCCGGWPAVAAALVQS